MPYRVRSFWEQFHAKRRPARLIDIAFALLALLGAWLINIIPIAILAGEFHFSGAVFWCAMAGVLALVVLPVAAPILPYHHLVARKAFPFLSRGYLLVVAYCLCVAGILAFGDLNRFIFLASLSQALALGTTLILLALRTLRPSVAQEQSAYSPGRRAADSVVALAIVAAIAASTPFTVWLPTTLFLKTDACLDAGGRMGGDSVCEYGSSRPN